MGKKAAGKRKFFPSERKDGKDGLVEGEEDNTKDETMTKKKRRKLQSSRSESAGAEQGASNDQVCRKRAVLQSLELLLGETTTDKRAYLSRARRR